MNEGNRLYAHRRNCAVCGCSDLDEVICLPDLPLTDTFCDKPTEDPYGEIDQALALCCDCGHAQLANVVMPHVLYGNRYHFRTSTSITAITGTDHFLSYLATFFPNRNWKMVLDVGCNDLYLLHKLKTADRWCVGVDPIWNGREHEVEAERIHVHGCLFEELNVDTAFDIPPDLIVCRHTLEHVNEPAGVLKKLLATAADDAVFLFEIPALEPLVEMKRFDHVFHQHLQYFTLSSFLNLLKRVGGRYLGHTWNYHDWGALLVLFEKGPWKDVSGINSWRSGTYIVDGYAMFQSQMKTSARVLDSLDGRLYGYGAAQMLPVLAYHLGMDLSRMKAILDDDPAKEGLGYWNLPAKVQHSSSAIDLSESSVLITAVDNAIPILRKLVEVRPRHIVYPLSIL